MTKIKVQWNASPCKNWYWSAVAQQWIIDCVNERCGVDMLNAINNVPFIRVIDLMKGQRWKLNQYILHSIDSITTSTIDTVYVQKSR